jgi:uncharacterized membrane protein
MTTAVLTAAYWLHMAATVVWIGGLFYQSALLYPLLAKASWTAETIGLMDRLRMRFNPLSWLSLVILIGTGLTQMAGNPNYGGLLVLQNRWSQAMLVKHIAVASMTFVAAYQTWILQPRLTHALLRQTREEEQLLESTLQSTRRIGRSIRLNLGLGFLVLALTAIARTA